MNNLNVSDELRTRIQPPLPVVQRRHRWPGRRRIDDRACLNGDPVYPGHRDRLPAAAQQLGYGSGMTCWRRPRDWQTAGVWDRLHELLLTELRATSRLDLARAIADSSHVRTLKGGPQPDQTQSTVRPRRRQAPTS